MFKLFLFSICLFQLSLINTMQEIKLSSEEHVLSLLDEAETLRDQIKTNSKKMSSGARLTDTITMNKRTNEERAQHKVLFEENTKKLLELFKKIQDIKTTKEEIINRVDALSSFIFQHNLKLTTFSLISPVANQPNEPTYEEFMDSYFTMEQNIQ